MAAARQYAVQVRDVVRAVAAKQGGGLAGAPKATRVVINTVALVVGVLCKLLVDKGVVTDAELADAFGVVQADAYADEPAEPAAG